MELLLFQLLCLSLSLGLARAWINEEHEDQDEVGSARWQLAYESWRLNCQERGLPARDEPQVSPRIARGELAEPGMFPYQAGLLLRLSDGEATQCGGCLISWQYVLTAAHCLNGVQSGRVYLGSISYADAAGAAAQVFEVEPHHFNAYPGYLGFAGYHDLALIRLPHPATPSAYVQPIALALAFMQPPQLQAQLVTSSGWGALGDAANDTAATEPSAEANLLHYVDVPLLQLELCVCYFLPGLVSARQHICSDGRQGRGSCQGDSGGPLVYRWRNVSYLIGLTAFGITSGCEQGGPTVYTRITAYLDWIAGETDGEGPEAAESGWGYKF